MIFSAHFILVIMYNPMLETAGSFPFHGNAAHEIMTGRFSAEEYAAELKRPALSPGRRRGKSKDRNYAFEPTIATGTPGFAATSLPADGGFASAPSNAPAAQNDEKEPFISPIQQQQQLVSQGGNNVFTNAEAQYAQQHFVFASVIEAMDAVKDSGDDVSEAMHNLVEHLDTLDDAMDDWDADNVDEENGEAYDDLMDEDHGYGDRGLPLHHNTAGGARRRTRRGDR
jgi:hypothetical protein